MSAAIDLADVAPGLADPILDSQRIFRCVMDAMARPGRIVDLGAGLPAPVPGYEAIGAIALTLLDFETPAFLPTGPEGAMLANWLRFHCGCPVTADAREACFALCRADALPRLEAFNAGDAKYPDRSATLLILCPSLEGGPVVMLEGPGIADSALITPQGLPEDFWSQATENRASFQLGVDIVLAAGDRIIGLPRSTRISASCIAQGE